MNVEKIKVVAMDLDGTLTQHKQPLIPENLATLNALSQRYRLLMVGAGQVMRILNQMGQYPLDIIGNYGMQYATYNAETKTMDIQRDATAPCDRESVEARVTMLREKYGFSQTLLDLVRVKHPVSRGLAMGSSAHAIGTAKAMEFGQTEGAMAGLAIAITGVLTVVIAPFFVNLI